MRAEEKKKSYASLPLPVKYNGGAGGGGETSRADVGSSRIFFFLLFGTIYRSSAWCCRSLSLNFYQWAALGPFEKPAGVRTMKQGCLYIWATKVIAVFTRNRISKKTSCHRHLKSCSPLLLFFFFFLFLTLGCLFIAQEAEEGGGKKEVRGFSLISTQQ